MTAKNRHTVFTFKYNIYNNRGAGHYADSPVCPILYRSELCNDFHRAVVIAMIAVLVMQTTVDQVIDMVAVRDSFMSATFSVNMGVVVMNGAVCHDASFDLIKVGQVLPGCRATR